MNTSHSWFLFGTWGMGIATVLLAFLAFKLKKSERFHGFLAAAITAIAFCSYFAMQSGLGAVETQGHMLQIARYVDWLVTTPLLLLSVLTLALPAVREAAQLRDRVVLYSGLIGLDVFMIATGILGELSKGNDRWVWFSVSTVAFVMIPYILYTTVLRESTKVGNKALTNLYRNATGFLVALWVLYPVVWYLSPVGTAAISDLATNQTFAVLDLLAKAVFGLLIVVSLLGMKSSKKA